MYVVQKVIYEGSCPHLIWLLFVVGEVAAQVVLALVLLHQLVHLLVLGVLLEVGVGTWNRPLQVIQLENKTLNYLRLRRFFLKAPSPRTFCRLSFCDCNSN